MVTNTRTTARAHADLDAVSRDAGMRPENESTLELSERDRIWVEQNQPFFESWNDYVEKNGIPLEQFRNF